MQIFFFFGFGERVRIFGFESFIGDIVLGVEDIFVQVMVNFGELVFVFSEFDFLIEGQFLFV